MKKLALSVFALSLLLLSCSKKQNTPAGAPASEKHNLSVDNSASASRESKGTKPNSTLYSDGWCRDRDVNCCVLPEVIITASARTLLRNAEENGPAQLINAFNNPELTEIANYLPDEYYNKIMSGNYYIATGAENSRSVSFMLGTTPDVAQHENVEFAFQLKKAL